jgi:hypothetical protein
MNALTVLCFALMARAYSGSDRLFYAVLVLFPALFFSLSRYDDAAIGYYMFIQTLVIYLSVSLILLKKYRDTGKEELFIAQRGMLYLLSLLTYEASYPLVLVYPLAAFHLFGGAGKDRIRKTVKRVCTIFHTAAVCCFLVYVYFSLNAVYSYDGINFNPDIGNNSSHVNKTERPRRCRVSPDLLFSANEKFSSFVNIIKTGIVFRDIVTALMLIACLLPVLIMDRKRVNLRLPEIRFLIGLSFLAIACPAVITGMSRKYQQNLQWGDGYLTSLHHTFRTYSSVFSPVRIHSRSV